MLKIQKFKDSQASNSQKQRQKKYCRVCLQYSKQIKKLPCACKGSLSYMHDKCLSQMLHVKIENQKDDVPDYVQFFQDSSNSGETIKVKCQICLHQIILEKQSRLSFERLVEVEIQVYFILIGMVFISVFGLNIAYNLLQKALEQTGVIIRVLYFAAYVWIIGVIGYVILQPLYSQVKVISFKIKEVTVQNSKKKYYQNKNKKHLQRWKKILKKLIPSFLKPNQQEFDIFGRRTQKNMKSKCKIEKQRLNCQNKYQPSNKQIKFMEDKVRYFQI